MLGTRVRGAFSFAAGIPAFSLENHASGLFPIIAGDAKHPALGAGIMTDGGLFAAASLGSKDSFFGLGGRCEYSGTRGVDMEAGHGNIHVRFSRQWSTAAPLIDRKVGLPIETRGRRRTFEKLGGPTRGDGQPEKQPFRFRLGLPVPHKSFAELRPADSLRWRHGDSESGRAKPSRRFCAFAAVAGERSFRSSQRGRESRSVRVWAWPPAASELPEGVGAA